jgi:stage IV sporulation protein B
MRSSKPSAASNSQPNKLLPNKLFYRHFIAPAALLLCAVLAYFTASFVFFPSEINLTENRVNRFSFNIPVTATILTESVSALSVNDVPVRGSVTVSLSEPLRIEPQESGTASMVLSAFGIPMKKVTLSVMPDIEVVPCGMTVGVRINTDGVMVLALEAVNTGDGTPRSPCEGRLKPGYLLTGANGETLNSHADLARIVENSEGAVNLSLKRGGQNLYTSVMPVKSVLDGKNKIGAWVRDSTQGIGTITYYNPATNTFAALGHGIMDVDTKALMSVKTGEIMESEITGVKKGGKGAPGELVGSIRKSNVLGNIRVNNPYGIYGSVNISALNRLPSERMKIAFQNDVHEGPARIRSNIERSEIAEYDVYIESVNRFSGDDTKGMVIRITDPELLRRTNGIVQGMSGSPINQDDRLVGAVTHVFVQDPSKGYGIFIENMLKQERGGM